MATFEYKLDQNSLAEFKGQIVDVFEDYLCEHNIVLVNTDRTNAIADGEVDEEDAAVIYGDQYDIIGDIIEEIVNDYDLLDTKTVMLDGQFENISEDLMVAFGELLAIGEADISINDVDTDNLTDTIKTIFVRWDLVR